MEGRGRVVKPPKRKGQFGEPPEEVWHDSWQPDTWNGGGGPADAWQSGPVEPAPGWPQQMGVGQHDSWQTGGDQGNQGDQGALANGGQYDQEVVAAVEELLMTNGGMLPFTEVTRYFPNVALKDLRTSFKVTFDGAWQVHANRAPVVVPARQPGLVTNEVPMMSPPPPVMSPPPWEPDSWQQPKAPERSPPATEDFDERPSTEPLEDAVFNRVIAMLLEAGGTMPLWRLCCNVPGVTKAQLMNYFELIKLPNGQYEVRMPSSPDESAQNKASGAKDEAATEGQAAAMTEEQVRDVAAYIVAQGGKTTEDEIFARFPGLTREHLAAAFDLQRRSGQHQGWNQQSEVCEVSLMNGVEYPGVQGTSAQQSYGGSQDWSQPDNGMGFSSSADQERSQQISGAGKGCSRPNSSGNKGWSQQSSSSNKGRSSRKGVGSEQQMVSQQSEMDNGWPPEESSGDGDWSGVDTAWPSEGPCKGGCKGGKAFWKGDMEGGKGCMVPGKGYMDGCKGYMAGGKGFDGAKGYMDGGKGYMDGCKGCMDGGKGFMDGGKGGMDGGKGFMDGGKGGMAGGKFGKGGKACKGGPGPGDMKWQPSLGPGALGPVFPVSWDPAWADYWGPPVAWMPGWEPPMAPGKGCWGGPPPDWGCKGEGWGCKGPGWGCKGPDWGGKGPDWGGKGPEWAGKGPDWGCMPQKGWGPWGGKGCNGCQDGPQVKRPRRTENGQQAVAQVVPPPEAATSWAAMAEGAEAAAADPEEASEWERLLQNWEGGGEAEEAA